MFLSVLAFNFLAKGPADFVARAPAPSKSAPPATSADSEKIVSLHKFDEKEIAASLAKKKEAREATEKELKRITAGLHKKRDDVEQRTFFLPPEFNTGSRENYWMLYIAVPDGDRPYLRFRWQYADEDWLFIRGSQPRLL